MTVWNENDPPKRAVLRELVKLAVLLGSRCRLTSVCRQASSLGGARRTRTGSRGLTRSARLSNGSPASGVHAPPRQYAHLAGQVVPGVF
jgi:hypothetical protein